MASIQGRFNQDDLESFIPFVNDEFRNHVVSGNVVTITETNVADPVRIELSFRDFTYQIGSRLSPVITGGTLSSVTYSVSNGLAWSEVASIRDVDLDAVEMYAATMTASNSIDDRQVIERMLRGDDQFLLSEQDDVVRSYNGNDTIRGAGGNDSLDGGTGIDTVRFIGRFRDYAFSEPNGPLFTVRDTVNNRDGEDILENIEIAVFSDLAVPLEFLGGASTFTEL